MNLPFFSHAVVQALGWTLLHALWQGVILAAVLLAFLPRLTNAKQRYRAAVATLAALSAAALVTFAWMYQPEPAPAEALLLPLPAEPATGGHWIDLSVQSDFWTRLIDWLNANHPAIVAVWMLGFAFFLLRMLGGLYYIREMRRTALPVPAHLQEKIAALSKRLAFSRPVVLLESALAHTPMALGCLKPVVLLPVGLINRLSPAEVEAVLAHELAHLLRHDWLLNLAQAFVETVFYYHPAVWWISGVIRRERENCCDDIAVQLTGNRILYARTLVSLQEMAQQQRLPAPELALGLHGSVLALRRKPQLLDRIKRLLQPQQQKVQLMEKLTATAILLAFLALIGIQNTGSNFIPQVKALAAAPFQWLAGDQPVTGLEALTDSIPKGTRREKISHDDGNKRVEMEVLDGKITRLNVDGKDIPETEFEEYEALTESIREESAPPPPPFPPDAPAQWLSPEAPGAPVKAWRFPTPEAPPTPPSFWKTPGPSELSTAKDANGNTVIRIKREGKPVEIIVRDGAVWVDGNKVNEGESMPLEGLSDGSDALLFRSDAPFAFEMPEIPEIPEIPEMPEAPEMPRLLELHNSELRESHAQSLRELELEMKALLEKLKAEQKDLKKDAKTRKKREQELEEARENLQETFREQQLIQREIQEARQRALLDRMRAEKERQGAFKVERYDNFTEAIRTQLLRDKLIADPENFSFELSAKKMKADGKEQPDEVRQRYVELYQKIKNKELSKSDKVQIRVNNN